MRDDAIGLARRHDRDHPEAVVERAIHFGARDFTEALQQTEDWRRRPTAALDDCAGVNRHHARQVFEHAAAGDVRESVHFEAIEQLGHNLRVDQRGTQEFLAECASEFVDMRAQLEFRVFQNASHQRKAVGVKSAGRDSDQHVAGAHAGRLRNFRALDDPDREAGQVVLARLVESAELRGLAADQAHAGLIASAGDALDDIQRDFLFELAAADVIEKEHWTRRVADDVVDAHRDAVDADGVVTAGLKRNHQLGADAIGARDQHRRAHLAGAVESDQRAEAADAADDVCAGCGLRNRAEERNQALLQRDIDAGLFVGHRGRHQFEFLRRASIDARNARSPFE